MQANPAGRRGRPEPIAFTDFLHPSSATHGVLGASRRRASAETRSSSATGTTSRRTGPAADLVLAGAGNDRISSRGGDDIVLAGIGDDFGSSAGRAAT